MSVLREQYIKIADELKEQQGGNVYQVPRLDKIVVNVGMGRAHEDASYRDMVLASLATITGQRPVVTKARTSIAGFKLREGMEIGAKVTLRGARAEDFLYRLIHVVLPRVRDFRGLSPKAFDGQGNYNVGLTEHVVFPEISYEDVTHTHPLQITIVTTSNDDAAALEVLKRLGFPFQGQERGADGA